MDNPADLLRYLACHRQSSTSNSAVVASRSSLQASTATQVPACAAEAKASTNFRAENNASTTTSDNFSTLTAQSPVNQVSVLQRNCSSISNNGVDRYLGSTNASCNNNVQKASTRISSNVDGTASSMVGAPYPLAALGQHAPQPPLIPLQINGGILDPQTRLLLETILRLDDQMRVVASRRSSSNIDTMSSSTSSGQQQEQIRRQKLQTSSQEAFTTESASSSAAPEAKTTGPRCNSLTASASVPMFRLKTNSSSSSSSEDETIQVPCRARGQPPEHNYLVSFEYVSMHIYGYVGSSPVLQVSHLNPNGKSVSLRTDGLLYH
jgi:hypothetical protein